MQFSFRVLPLAISAMFCWSAALSGTPHECDRAWFCDGFEDDEVGRLPGAPWSDQTNGTGAIIEVGADRVFSGRHSLHVLAPKSRPRRGYLAIHGSPLFPAASRRMYGRVMIWLDAAPEPAPGAAPVHWTLMQGEGRASGDRNNAIYRLGLEQRGGLGLMANYETTPPVRSDCRQRSVRDLPVARWTCVEWHFDGDRDELQFWLDGAELRDIHVVGRGNAADSHCAHQDDLHGRWLAPPAFQSVFMGIERYDASGNDQNLWLDDVVIAPQRVGCPVPPSRQNQQAVEKIFRQPASARPRMAGRTRSLQAIDFGSAAKATSFASDVAKVPEGLFQHPARGLAASAAGRIHLQSGG